jgi:hypothetical protein
VLDDRPELLQDDAFCQSIVDRVCVWLYGDRGQDSGKPPRPKAE